MARTMGKSLLGMLLCCAVGVGVFSADPVAAHNDPSTNTNTSGVFVLKASAQLYAPQDGQQFFTTDAITFSSHTGHYVAIENPTSTVDGITYAYLVRLLQGTGTLTSGGNSNITWASAGNDSTVVPANLSHQWLNGTAEGSYTAHADSEIVTGANITAYTQHSHGFTVVVRPGG